MKTTKTTKAKKATKTVIPQTAQQIEDARFAALSTEDAWNEWFGITKTK